MDWEKPIGNIRGELRTYIEAHKLQALVVGISGGIDSAACAALARPVCDTLGIPLIGRSYPILSNKDDEKQRAIAIGQAYCTEFEEKDLSREFADLAVMLNLVETTDLNSKIRAGNAKARMRMINLYNIASERCGMVLSTDNLTELLLGFWTLHGDVGDYGMIQKLWKTEVYAMAKYMASTASTQAEQESLMACVDATPTDGLGITNSDLDQLGVDSYDEADRILKIWTEGKDNKEEYANHPIVLRYERTHFKRENPYNIPRETILG